MGGAAIRAVVILLATEEGAKRCMTSSCVDDDLSLAHALAMSLPDLSRDAAFSLAVLRLLACGQPVAIPALMAALQRSEAAILKGIGQLTNVERDDAGNLVAAAGLSLRPTPHHFAIAGRALYTWCALDTLMYPALLRVTANVSSPCPTTGVTVRVTVAPDGIHLLDPTEAVVSLLVPDTEAACCDVRSAFCDRVSYFVSRDAAALWVARQPQPQAFTILPVAAAFAVGAQITAVIYGSALGASPT